MNVTTESSRIKKHVDRIVAIATLRKLSKLVGAIRKEEEKNAGYVQRIVLTIGIFVAYPVPAFGILFSPLMRAYPSMGRLIFWLFLLSWV